MNIQKIYFLIQLPALIEKIKFNPQMKDLTYKDGEFYLDVKEKDYMSYSNYGKQNTRAIRTIEKGKEMSETRFDADFAYLIKDYLNLTVKNESFYDFANKEHKEDVLYYDGSLNDLMNKIKPMMVDFQIHCRIEQERKNQNQNQNTLKIS